MMDGITLLTSLLSLVTERRGQTYSYQLTNILVLLLSLFVFVLLRTIN